MQPITFNKLNQHTLTIEGYYSHNFRPYDMPYHKHNSFEIMYVEEGKCVVVIIDEADKRQEVVLLQNQFIFINSNIHHRLVVDEDNQKILNIEFSASPAVTNFNFCKMTENCEKLHLMLQQNADYYKLNDVFEVYTTLKRLIVLLSSDKTLSFTKENEIISTLLLYQLLIEISKCNNIKNITGGVIHIKKCIDFLYQQYNQNITVEDIAKYVGISASYLQKLFKDCTNKTIIDYINELRIEKSAQLIKNSNLSIAEIYTKCGFNNRQNFDYNFKKIMNLTLSEYREKIKFPNVKYKDESVDTERIAHELKHPNYI